MQTTRKLNTFPNRFFHPLTIYYSHYSSALLNRNFQFSLSNNYFSFAESLPFLITIPRSHVPSPFGSQFSLTVPQNLHDNNSLLVGSQTLLSFQSFLVSSYLILKHYSSLVDSKSLPFHSSFLDNLCPLGSCQSTLTHSYQHGLLIFFLSTS